MKNVSLAIRHFSKGSYISFT